MAATTITYQSGMKFEYHEVADLFRAMTEEEFVDFVDDIAINGVLVPVWMHQGKVVDGKHRSRAWLQANEQEAEKPESLSLLCPECDKPVAATRSKAGQNIECPHCNKVCDKCRKEGFTETRHNGTPAVCPHRPTIIEIPATLARRAIPPLPVREWNGQGSLVAFVFSQNVHRRHLDVQERAELVLQAAGLMEQEAAERMRAGRPASPDAKGKAAAKLANIARVSQATMERMKVIHKRGTKELQEATRKKRIGISKAAQIARLSPQEQLRAIEKEAKDVGAKNRALDVTDALARWEKAVHKIRKQMAKLTAKMPKLIEWADIGLELLKRERKRLARKN